MMLGKIEQTARGFEIIRFSDCYLANCSLQQSSLCRDVDKPGYSAVWLGVDDAKPQILKTHAEKFGLELPPGEVSGWMPYPIPPEVSITTRMHLNQDQVAALIKSLQRWLDTGSFEDEEVAG